MKQEPAEFSASTFEEAVNLAVSHFGVPAEQLDISVIQEQGLLQRLKGKVRVKACLLSDDESVQDEQAPITPTTPTADRKTWRLMYRENGVFLNIMPFADGYTPTEKEQAAQWAAIAVYGKQKQLKGLNEDAVRRAVKKSAVENGIEVQIAPAQQEILLPERLETRLEDNGMVAFARLMEPEKQGLQLTMEAMVQSLWDENIRFGVDRVALQLLLDQRSYGEWICCARGIPPENGADGQLQFHFRTSAGRIPNVVKHDSRMDLYTLDLFDSVKKGDALITMVEETEGIPGTDVTGAVLPAKAGKKAVFPKGRNVEIVVQESPVMVATCDGRVDMVQGTVVVSSVYEIPHDVDLTVGNIDFNGDVIIRGMIPGGFQVKAKRNIEVFGLVEGAKLEAEGDIILHQGMQGAGRGSLIAKGNITARFLERVIVQGHDITADALVNCKTEATGSLFLQGRRGIMTGGFARANDMIVAKFIGSSSQNITICEVGALPSDRERQKVLERKYQELQRQYERFDALSLSVPAAGAKERPEHQEARLKAVRVKMQLAKQIHEIKEESEEINERLEGATDGKIHVLGTIYAGSRISIGSSAMIIQSDIPFATFRRRAGDVVFVACEYTEDT